jgi:hypothetical protein
LESPKSKNGARRREAMAHEIPSKGLGFFQIDRFWKISCLVKRADSPDARGDLFKSYSIFLAQEFRPFVLAPQE